MYSRLEPFEQLLKRAFLQSLVKIPASSQEMFVCFVALRPKSTAMVMAGRSVHQTTLFSWASTKSVNFGVVGPINIGIKHVFLCINI